MKGNTFQVQTISLAQIKEPDGYQRDLEERIVAEIVDKFDAAQWDLPKVAAIEDGYRAIAGQHRIEAARRFLQIGDWPFMTPAGFLDVQVIVGLETVADEADLFLKDAVNKTTIQPYFRHRAGIIAGYQSAVDIQAALDRRKVQLVRRQKILNGATFSSISSLYSIWRRAHSHGGDAALVVDETLRLRNLWNPADTYRSDGSVVGGLGIVVEEELRAYGHADRVEKLVKRYAAITIASAALKLQADSGSGKGRSLSQPFTYAVVIRERLGPPPKPRAPKTPEFMSDLPYKEPYSSGRTGV